MLTLRGLQLRSPPDTPMPCMNPHPQSRTIRVFRRQPAFCGLSELDRLRSLPAPAIPRTLCRYPSKPSVGLILRGSSLDLEAYAPTQSLFNSHCVWRPLQAAVSKAPPIHQNSAALAHSGASDAALRVLARWPSDVRFLWLSLDVFGRLLTQGKSGIEVTSIDVVPWRAEEFLLNLPNLVVPGSV